MRYLRHDSADTGQGDTSQWSRHSEHVETLEKEPQSAEVKEHNVFPPNTSLSVVPSTQMHVNISPDVSSAARAARAAPELTDGDKPSSSNAGQSSWDCGQGKEHTRTRSTEREGQNTPYPYTDGPS